MTPLRWPPRTLAVAVLLAAAGCKDREIAAYRIPKEPVPAPQAAAATADRLPEGHPPLGGETAAPAPAAAPGGAMGTLPASAVAAGQALAWTAPEHWQAKPPGGVRKGSYAVTGDGGTSADLAITAFPGDTGGLQANINRWRGQIGLANAGPAEIERALERFEANGLTVILVDLTGPQGVRLLGGIVPVGGETWFFKLTGPEPLVARERAAFRAFLETVRTR